MNRIVAGLSPALAMLLALCATAAAARDGLAGRAPASHANDAATRTPARGSIGVALDAATLSALPRERIRTSAHGKTLDCEGVALAALLQRAGAMPQGRLPGAALSSYVLVAARDGYRVLYSLAELDPGTGRRRVLVIDRCGGKPLDTQDGPLRLIAPEDARPARWVRQLQAISVVRAP